MSSNKKSFPLSPLTSNPILTGAAVLTLAGFASRIIGFFYRIFISQHREKHTLKTGKIS